MNEYGMAYANVTEVLENAIDSAFYDFQTENGIESGDVPPRFSYDIEMAKATLADIIRNAMAWQYENTPHYEYEQTYAPDTDTTFIMRNTYWTDHGDYVMEKREVVGFYAGEPNVEDFETYKNAGTVAEF